MQSYFIFLYPFADFHIYSLLYQLVYFVFHVKSVAVEFTTFADSKTCLYL